MISRGRVSAGARILRKNSVGYSVIVILIGACLMTTSMIIVGQKKDRIVFEFENIVIEPEDFRYVSTYLEENWRILISYEVNMTISVYMLKQSSFDQISTDDEIGGLERALDKLEPKPNEQNIVTSVQETGGYVFILQNANKTCSILVSDVVCSAELTGGFSVPPLDISEISLIFYAGLILTVLNIAWFVLSQLEA